MNISQEILVLDFGDEKNEFLRSEADFGGGECFILNLTNAHALAGPFPLCPRLTQHPLPFYFQKKP